MGSLTPPTHEHVQKRSVDDGAGATAAEDRRLSGLDGPTLTLFYQLLQSLQNSSAGNASTFQLKPIFLHNYIFFSFIYGLLGVSGVFSNVYFIWRNIRLKLYKSSLYYFLIHIALTHAVSAALILPTSLAILLSRYWIFGDFMCYTLTMVQDLPSRVVLLLFVLIAIDRYRQFAYNSLDALPKHGCVIGVWLISFCLAFPACVFVEFYEMYSYIKLEILQGIGLCVVNNHSMEEYARAMFVVVYVVPLAVFAFAFTRISVELPKQDQPVVLAQLPTPRAGRTADGLVEEWPLAPSVIADSGIVNADVERRVQRYLTACGIVVAVSSLPLNVMSVIQFGLTEDYGDKSASYDVTYAMFVWISFLPTVCTPALCLGMMSVAGCPLFYRLMKRWREGTMGDYVRRLSDFASTSAAAGIMRLYPRTGAHLMTDASDTTMSSLGRGSQSIASSRTTGISALTVSASATCASLEKRHPPEESMALMRIQERQVSCSNERRLSVIVIPEPEWQPQRRASLSTAAPDPVVSH